MIADDRTIAAQREQCPPRPDPAEKLRVERAGDLAAGISVDDERLVPEQRRQDENQDKNAERRAIEP